MDAFKITEGQDFIPPNVTLRGPKYEPSSVRRVMNKLDNRLASLHYDKHYLDQKVEKVYKPVQQKFTKFYDAKLKYGKFTNPISERLDTYHSYETSTNIFADSQLLESSRD